MEGFPQISANYNFDPCSSILCRERQKFRLKIPNSLRELGQISDANKIAKACIGVIGKSAVMFTTYTLLAASNDSDDVFMDGTFENISSKPNIHQLYTIYIKCRDTYVAAFLVLMENRDTAIYNEVFKWIKSQALSLETNNKLIFLSDFEKATIKALRQSFPVAKIHGCYFHYVHAIIRKWTKMRLDIPDIFLSMILTVPLLPCKKFNGAEKILKVDILINNYSAKDTNILLFMDYFHKTWISHSNHMVLNKYGSMKNQIIPEWR
ncbi:uncharacterized protein LOC130669708 isoform X2 [Microplitis mediator]|uniref:uncharacterized protein LOC130669708 isoform X2 n=1 Tax=Microplitis mediator TaxID=375433 RepID=UPI002556B727|nr:uncharacterized protein LOC130669708 isoform X2 [Microplitis mediator]